MRPAWPASAASWSTATCAPATSACATAAFTSFDRDTFPHEVTGFSLAEHTRTEQGERFACEDCHTTSLTSFDQAVCADCHARDDPEFMREHIAVFGRDCLPCHPGDRTDLSDFDHDRFASRLTGAHVNVACDECHQGDTSLQEYRDTPQDCYSCHAEDDEHEGAFGRACGDCHATSDWSDVTFDHSVFPLDHGSDERTATCQTCHPDGNETYTCYGCHEHTQARVLDQHEGMTLTELEHCVRCHPQGRKEGEQGDVQAED